MSKQTQLIPVRYKDAEKGIHLMNYADMVIYADETQKTLCAIRFGGYPESVEAMAVAIYGGGSVEAELSGNTVRLKALAKRYRKKVTHDGVYAEATLFAEDEDAQVEKSKKQNGKSSDDDMESDGEAPEDLSPRRAFIYTSANDTKALFAAIDEKTAVPLIAEFADYFIDELIRRGYLKKLCVQSATAAIDAWSLKCTAQDKNIIEVIEDGLHSDAIAIPGAAGSLPMPEVNSVTDYLTAFGPSIAERIKSSFVPLFNPAQDTLSPEVLAVNEAIRERAGYSLYDAQLAVAESIKRQLARHKAGLIIAECGSGKTKIGLAAIAAATTGLIADQTRRGKTKTFNIVLCPAHVAEKWCREIAETLPNTKACVVKGITAFDRLYSEYSTGAQSVYAIISKETARDGYMHAPAAVWSRRANSFVCSDCGEVIMMNIMIDGASYTVPSDQYYFKTEKRVNHKCAHCGTPLWTLLNPDMAEQKWVKIGGYGFVYRPQALNHLAKTKNPAFIEKIYKVADGTHRTIGAHRKFPLATHIKNRYKRRIDGLIVDELHQYSNDSGQGDAMAELFGSAQKVIGRTATLINGYASGIFHLLYRLVPGLMESDGQRHSSPGAFASEYGVVETTYELSGDDYSSNRRSVRRKKSAKQLPGVSPLVYSRFLLEHAAFLSLMDMGKDLPEYEEIPVALELPEEVLNVCTSISETLRQLFRSDKAVAKKVLSSFINLLIAYPDQSYDMPTIYHPINGVPLVEPPDIGDIETLMPKDEATLDIVQRKLEVGENVMIYVNWTRLDSQKKLKKLLTDNGYRTEIMPATVPPVKREKWVQDRLDAGMKVLICNPSLVEQAWTSTLSQRSYSTTQATSCSHCVRLHAVHGA